MLEGKNILIVEDEELIAADLVNYLTIAGAAIVGPANTIDAVRQLLKFDGKIAAAILDVHLNDDLIWPVLDVLERRGTPVLFLTGSDNQHFPVQYRHLPHCLKPVPIETVYERLLDLLRFPQNSIAWRK